MAMCMDKNTVYLLSTKYVNYDSYDSAVIIAGSELEARKLAKEDMSADEQHVYINKRYLDKQGRYIINNDVYKTKWDFMEAHPEINIWTDNTASKCTIIGESTLDSQIVLSSYNAG